MAVGGYGKAVLAAQSEMIYPVILLQVSPPTSRPRSGTVLKSPIERTRVHNKLQKQAFGQLDESSALRIIRNVRY
jgi:hypothetical protein